MDYSVYYCKWNMNVRGTINMLMLAVNVALLAACLIFGGYVLSIAIDVFLK